MHHHDDIFQVLAETGPIIAAWKLPQWRATKRVIGQITGVAGNVTILATDGNLGIFRTDDTVVFLGHIQHFTGKVEPINATGPKAAVAKKKPLSRRARAKKELEDI